jgi:hypothetical protein
MSAQAPRQVHPSTICSTNPGRNYEVAGEVRVSSAADIAGRRATGWYRPARLAGAGVAGRVKALEPVASLFEQHC